MAASLGVLFFFGVQFFLFLNLFYKFVIFQACWKGKYIVHVGRPGDFARFCTRARARVHLLLSLFLEAYLNALA